MNLETFFDALEAIADILHPSEIDKVEILINSITQNLL